MDMWIAFITEVGFPMAVTFYLLHRIEGKLNVEIATIYELLEKMSQSFKGVSYTACTIGKQKTPRLIVLT